jgi:hypothetical protein
MFMLPVCHIYTQIVFNYVVPLTLSGIPEEVNEDLLNFKYLFSICKFVFSFQPLAI